MVFIVPSCCFCPDFLSLTFLFSGEDRIFDLWGKSLASFTFEIIDVSEGLLEFGLFVVGNLLLGRLEVLLEGFEREIVDFLVS
jgi:hypothetical protein